MCYNVIYQRIGRKSEMKKLLCLLLCLAMALAVCGCGNDSDETTGTTAGTTETTVPPTTEPGIHQDTQLQLPMIAICMPLTIQRAAADDGATVYTTTFQDVALTLPDTEFADAIILDLLNRIDETKGDSAELADLAQGFYDGSESWVPYYSDVTYSPARIDEKIISLYGKVGTYFGGTHASYMCVSANYDLATGKVLYLTDILVDEAACSALCEAINAKLTEIKDAYYIYTGFEEVVNDTYGGAFAEGAAPIESWFLSPTGLTVYFSPYDIAPYSSGPILVNIPYANLEGILKEDFFPADLPENPSGTVTAELAQDVDLDYFTQFGEAILNDGGERVVLYSDKLVTNVTIETGTWSANGITYTPTATVFYATSLSYQDAIMLETEFAGSMPALRLSYASNGETHRFFITQSGADGSIILLDDLT